MNFQTVPALSLTSDQPRGVNPQLYNVVIKGVRRHDVLPVGRGQLNQPVFAAGGIFALCQVNSYKVSLCFLKWSFCVEKTWRQILMMNLSVVSSVFRCGFTE